MKTIAFNVPQMPPKLLKVGDTVKKGQVICIVEAMKLMNEIESEVDGVVVDFIVDDVLELPVRCLFCFLLKRVLNLVEGTAAVSCLLIKSVERLFFL